MAQLNDLKLSALRTILGVSGGQTTQLECDALRFKGAVGNQLNDLWMDFLTRVAALKQPRGNLNTMQYNWLGELGFYGNLNERWMQFWANDWATAEITEDFRTQIDNGWICARASQAINVAVIGQLGIYSVNQMRFFYSFGVFIEAIRTNNVPNTINFSSWTKVGGTISMGAAAICANQQAGKFTCDVDVSPALHTLYCDTPVGADQYVGLYFKPDPQKNKYRLECRGLNFNIYSDGGTDNPDLVRSLQTVDGWWWFEFNVSAGSAATLLALYMLDENGDVSWIADQPYEMGVFGFSSYDRPFLLSHFPNNTAGTATAAADDIHKAPWAGFDGNDFELVVGFVPEFNSDQGVLTAGEIVLFEFGDVGTNQIKLYYNKATRQMIFDRYAATQAAFVIADPQLEFSSYEELIVTIRQTALDGISIDVKDSGGINASAAAKAVSALPAGDMYLGSAKLGTGHINGAIPFVEFYSPAPITMRQL